ncbi:acetate--CoA ligase family protein [Porticoccaceae bacterium]|nr:acetate--CoA ligase family protein [Porticoccaceae bacterium]
MANLKRFLTPKSIAIYGGSWAMNVIEQLQISKYNGEIWPVHPNRSDIGGIKCFADTQSLPGVPDAAFIGVNRELTVEIIGELNSIDAGGAICFASGYREANEEHQIKNSGYLDLQDQLVSAAGNMPMLGPNCYGYLNYLDNVTLWPDQHGGHQVDKGVAIIAQSSNVAINMTMQQRGLSVAALCTVGNQACVGLNELAEHFIADHRISTLGLFIEGFSDIPAFEAMALKARLAGKSIVVLKLGKSEKSQHATLSHTATLAGGSAASSALLQRLGIVEVNSVSEFIETLKILDVIGPLTGSKISSISCSGGEASLMADAAHNSTLKFPDLNTKQCKKLTSVLGNKVTISNPLDYHTYVWGDVPSMTECFVAVMEGNFDLNVFVLDIPRPDKCETQGHQCAIDAIIAAQKRTHAIVAVITSLPENIDEATTDEFHRHGVVVLHGLESGLKPIEAAVAAGKFLKISQPVPVWLQTHKPIGNLSTFTESKAKRLLSKFGLAVPQTKEITNKGGIEEFAKTLAYPLALKSLGLAHKSEFGAVILNIDSDISLRAAIEKVPVSPEGYLLEEMVDEMLVEIIIGVSRDTSGMLLLTMGAGGILTELLNDSSSLVMPVTRSEVKHALSKTKINQILQGYRGAAAANINSIVDAVMSVQKYVEANKDSIVEIDINPLIVRERDAVAVDALVRQYN